MYIERFFFKDRKNNDRRCWTVKVVITKEEKENLERGAAKFGDPFISTVVSRIDCYAPQNDKERERFGKDHYWFWLFEKETGQMAESLIYCLTAVAKDTSVASVRAEYIKNVDV